MKITRDTQWQKVKKQSWGGQIMNRIIEVEGGDFVEAVIYWRGESQTIKNEWGVTYNKPTGNYNPCLHLSYWRTLKTGGFASSGLGDFYPLSGSHARRVIRPLAEASAQFTADQLLELMVSKDIKAIL